MWANETEDAPGHSNLKAIPPWREALDTEGIRGMSAIAAILDGVEWWRLRPAQELLAEQPGQDDAREFIAVAATEERDLLVAYLPSGGGVTLCSERLTGQAAWHDTRTGESRRAEATAHTFTAPDESDW